MLAHTVIFWLDQQLSDKQNRAFEGGLSSLCKIGSVRQGVWGKPGSTVPRPVIDRTYSYAITVIFDDVRGHDEYQVDPIHKEFVDKFNTFWTRLTIYDYATS
jgi:hypothetical protein